MRLIDADILEKSLTEIDEHINMDIFTNEVRELIDNAPIVEAIPKADYENRLKADMVNMLEDLNKEMNSIKECEYQIYRKEHWNFVGKCQDVINSKINGIKRESCAKENGCISCSLEDEDCCRKLFENSMEETLR